MAVVGMTGVDVVRGETHLLRGVDWPVPALVGAFASLLAFLRTPVATQAMISRPGGVPAGRFRPPVYVTIWSEPRQVH